MNDPWLNDEEYFFLRSSQPMVDQNWIVGDLFIPDTRIWNVQLIQELFITEDVERIMRTMPCQNNHDDRLIWHFSRDGKYSVKSTYKLATMAMASIQELFAN